MTKRERVWLHKTPYEDKTTAKQNRAKVKVEPRRQDKSGKRNSIHFTRLTHYYYYYTILLLLLIYAKFLDFFQLLPSPSPFSPPANNEFSFCRLLCMIPCYLSPRRFLGRSPKKEERGPEEIKILNNFHEFLCMCRLWKLHERREGERLDLTVMALRWLLSLVAMYECKHACIHTWV